MDLNTWYWMMFWPKLRCSLYWNRCEWMLSWPNIKCYVDWKISYRKVKRRIWSTMWIRSFYRGRCHDLNLSDMWTGQDVTGSFHDQFEVIWLSTDDKESCHDLIWHDIWIGTDVKWCCLDQITVKCGLDSMWQEVSWPIWRNIWIRTDDTGWWRDLIWYALNWNRCDIMLLWPNLKCYVDWNICDTKRSRKIWSIMWNRREDRGWCHDLIWCALWIGTNVI
jgi:hypothetical protein